MNNIPNAEIEPPEFDIVSNSGIPSLARKIPISSSWISVDDRLPDDDRQVLTFTVGKTFGADTYCIAYGWINACGDDIPYPITHWCDITPPNNQIAGWRYDTPDNDRRVLACGHAGVLTAYWAEGIWWETWSGDDLDLQNTEIWAWQELPEKCTAKELTS